jgi:hypothetical protein
MIITMLGFMTSLPRPLLRLPLKIARRLKYVSFEKGLHQAAELQRQWVLDRVRRCQATRFGIDHGFAKIRSFEDFRRQVPVSDYQGFAPYINAVAAGDSSALIPEDDELIQFTITTGSTGVPKLNPVTRSWLKQYRATWEIWGTKLFTDHPDRIGSKILQMAGTWDMGRTVGGHQISMVSALLTRTQSPLMKPFYAIPEIINTIPDPAVRHYTALRLCICQKIGWIMLMNPGTLIRLAEIGDQHKQLLIRDLFDGTLSTELDIPNPIRTALRPLTSRSDRRGAQFLEQIVKTTGRLLPKDYWKQPVISCWLGGTAGFASRYLRDYFGNSPLRDMGLVSSEGRHTIPLQDEDAFGVPTIGAGCYEFIPVEELSGQTSTVLEGHELEIDHDYRIVISNSAGYFRFDIGDIVRCRGFHGQAPQLEFRQKNDRIGDLEGEKLTEHQILEGAHKAAAKIGVQIGLLTGVPRRFDGRKPWYDFVVSIGDIPDSELARNFLRELDHELAALNFLWRARRKEGVIAPPQLQRINSDGWDNYLKQESKRRGTGDYQYKHPGLVQDQSWLNNFTTIDIVCSD